MKTANRVRMVAGLVTAAWLIATASAQKKTPDFSEFAGRYRGQLGLITFANFVLPASSNIRVKVPRNGRSAVFFFSGSLIIGGQSFPISNTFTFTRRRKVIVADPVFFINDPTGAAAGRYRQTGNTVRFSVAPPQPTTTTRGFVKLRPKGNRKRLLVFFEIVDNGDLYQFPFRAIGRKRR